MGLCNKPRCLIVGFLLVSVVLTILSAISYPLLHSMTIKNLIIKPGSQIYDMWKKGGDKVPIYFEIYIFNLTNEEAVVNTGAKPKVEQLGPYVYREYREKFNITFNANGTVSYRERKQLSFDPERSRGNETDQVTTINIVLITVLSYIPVKIPLLDFLMKHVAKEDIFTTHAVRELVFGYEDPLLKLAMDLFPKYIHSDRIGVLSSANGTDDGLYTVHTGEKDYKLLGVIDKWNGRNHLDIWSSKYANMINGTDGTLAPPLTVDKHFVTKIYTTDLCRSVSATFEKEVDHEGVRLYRYSAPKWEFENYTVNPDNAGFCVPAGNCFGAGILDDHKCIVINGIEIPVMTSNPHFLYGDPHYINAIEGMHPNLPDLNTAIDIEPKTGLVLKASKRLQINLYVNNTNITSNVLHKTPTMIYPILWVNESASADETSSHQVHSQLQLLNGAAIAQLVAFGVAAFLLVATVMICALYPSARPCAQQESSAAATTEATTEDEPLITDHNPAVNPEAPLE